MTCLIRIGEICFLFLLVTSKLLYKYQTKSKIRKDCAPNIPNYYVTNNLICLHNLTNSCCSFIYLDTNSLQEGPLQGKSACTVIANVVLSSKAQESGSQYIIHVCTLLQILSTHIARE